ncbi:hypothetical protein MUG78_17395 [Gordonia alkaliphila]|uniref:hypothetical protein n=1 Tax=Gordonia alkaliphila TaxID=1053547 RepID=UPI001FF4ACC7|nr:hypothetical protein [Gordonia alkaliphila]MCK0441177.1 hypothetical protein [Gordonia alkaliphila]
MQQPHSPVLVLRDGGQHKIENAAGMTIIVMGDTRLDVGDGALVYAFAPEPSDGNDQSPQDVHRPLIRVTGSSTVVSYGALVQQESGTVHGNDATEIYSTAGTATVADVSTIHLIEGSTTAVTARNSSRVLLHQPHRTGLIALYDFSTAVGNRRAVLAGSDLQIFSAAASAWIGNPEDESSEQYTEDEEPAAAPPTVAAPAEPPAPSSTLAAPASSRGTEVTAAEATAAPTSTPVRPTPPSPPPAPLYVPPQDPSMFNEQQSSANAPGSTALPEGAPSGHVLYDDYPTEGLVLADWEQMWPWVRGPWWEITESVGTHPDLPSAALASIIPAASAASVSSPGQRLGTVTVPDAASLSTQRFTPPGM